MNEHGRATWLRHLWDEMLRCIQGVKTTSKFVAVVSSSLLLCAHSLTEPETRKAPSPARRGRRVAVVSLHISAPALSWPLDRSSPASLAAWVGTRSVEVAMGEGKMDEEEDLCSRRGMVKTLRAWHVTARRTDRARLPRAWICTSKVRFP